ncbi:MAG: leucyl/phenylalanyl-tRNA--protein transferase [Acidimicrobiales bacterium]
MPVEPPPSRWQLPDPVGADEHGVVGIGADLEPGTLLAAYRHGLFPMPVERRGPLAWWSPDPRGVIPLGGLRVSRSLRKARTRFEVRVDTSFGEVLDACADRRRPGGWISAEIAAAYGRLHELGWAHSVEAWDDGGLAGGLYGVAVGGLFAGESMFHRRPDASKVALVGLVEELRADGLPRLLDVQWTTDHLRSLGAVDVDRGTYLERLAVARALPLPSIFS